ncbi:MAG: hypothetical protein LBS18_05355, partial [Clostridiales bacterium]|nr:hypothetical protein [Clostridiales bacterium]
MFDYKYRIQQAKCAIGNAEYILIGGGAGLSDAAGLHYIGKRFADNFAPFIEKYGFEDLYTSSFYPFRTQEERWAYWAKHISVNRYDTPATELYKELFRLVKEKRYFVITTNVEHQFIKAGFPAEKVYAVQGNYGYFQCARGCHNTLYDNEEQVKAMVAHTHDCRIPTFLIPKCPVCAGEMDAYIRHNEYFVQDENWYKAESHYIGFLKSRKGKSTVFIELGVGFNTPGIIRIPFEQMTCQNRNTTLIRVNRDFPQGVKENTNRTIAFTEDMAQIIEALNRNDRKQARLVSINPTTNGGENMSKLNVLDAWKEGVSKFFSPKSAQGFMQPAMAVAGSCGSSCGAGGDKPKEEPKPSA